MEQTPSLYSDRSYETPEDPQESRSRKRRAFPPPVPNPSPVSDEGNTVHPYSSQPAWAPEVNRYVDALEEEVSALEPEDGANVGGRRQSRNASSQAQEPDGNYQEYGDSEERTEYRQRDANPGRGNNNRESSGQTSSHLNANNKTLVDHILREYPYWMDQADIEKDYKAVDAMIEVFRNSQRAGWPMPDYKPAITEMSKQGYKILLDSWHDMNHRLNRSSPIEADTARNRNEGVEQLENNSSRERVRAQSVVDPQITRHTSAPNNLRTTGGLIRSTAPLAQAPTGPANYRSQHSGPGRFVSTGSYTPTGPANYRSQHPGLGRFVGTGSYTSTGPANYRSQHPGLGRFVSTGSYTSTAGAVGAESRSEIVRLATAYRFPHANEPLSGPQPQAERIESGTIERLTHDAAAARRRVIQPYIFNPVRGPVRFRGPSLRQHANAQEAMERVAFPAPGRLQIAAHDVRSSRDRPSDVVDHDDGVLPDSQ